MSRLLPILACLLLCQLTAGAAPPAPMTDDPGASCAHACPCETPAKATADEAGGHHGAHRCPAGGADESCPPGCDDCPCCPGGLVVLTHDITILPPVHDIREALSGPPERRAAGTSERLFIPPECAFV